MKNAVIVEEERQSRSTWGVGGIVKDLLQGKVGQVEFYFKEIYIDIFPWVDVFRIRYLHRKHIPLLNKKKIIGYFISRGFCHINTPFANF